MAATLPSHERRLENGDKESIFFFWSIVKWAYFYIPI